MKELTNIVKAALPVAIGVAIGMFAYNKIDALTSK